MLPGVRYGRKDELLTPAYWEMRCATADMRGIDFVKRHGTLADEIGFCLLGGFGVTYEVANAFYERLRDNGAFDPAFRVPESAILSMLIEPADVNGRPHRYRFPNQRARRIHLAIRQLSNMELESDPVAFRNQIQALEGIGPKTASWIARNWHDTDNVAILDVHVIRAGWVIKLFERTSRLPQDYLMLEGRFIMFAQELQVRPSVLDAVMWSDMRSFGSSMVRELVAA